jgi:hypothetical protein
LLLEIVVRTTRFSTTHSNSTVVWLCSLRCMNKQLIDNLRSALMPILQYIHAIYTSSRCHMSCCPTRGVLRSQGISMAYNYAVTLLNVKKNAPTFVHVISSLVIAFCNIIIQIRVYIIMHVSTERRGVLEGIASYRDREQQRHEA